MTNGESRFKESYIALVSLPEIGAWITFVIMVFFRTIRNTDGTFSFTFNALNGTFALGAVAILLYMIVNFVHMIVHPRRMVPNSFQTYKIILKNYRCSSYFYLFIAYAFTFKFSLISVSWFFVKPSLCGDYSAHNWKVFNRLSIAFVCLPYPLMMIACIYFLMKDGFFSYPGFVAVEIILLSTILMVLMLLDSLSSIRCTTVGKKNYEKKSNKAIGVATGADYDSDDDKPSKRALKKAMQMDRADR